MVDLKLPRGYIFYMSKSLVVQDSEYINIILRFKGLTKRIVYRGISEVK